MERTEPVTNPQRNHKPLPCRYTLKDGRQIELAFLGPADRADFHAGFQGLSARSRYLRFFSTMPELPDFVANGLLKTDTQNHVAICARMISTTGQPLRPIVGVARYYRSSVSERSAEPAIAVADSFHGAGIAKLLLRRLSAIARSNGVTHFCAQVLNGNLRMQKILLDADARIIDQEDGVLTYKIDIRKQGQAPRGVLKKLLQVMQGKVVNPPNQPQQGPPETAKPEQNSRI